MRNFKNDTNDPVCADLLGLHVNFPLDDQNRCKYGRSSAIGEIVFISDAGGIRWVCIHTSEGHCAYPNLSDVEFVASEVAA